MTTNVAFGGKSLEPNDNQQQQTDDTVNTLNNLTGQDRTEEEENVGGRLQIEDDMKTASLEEAE